MKNRNIFYMVYFSLIILTVITIFILSILGNKTRVGYISDFKFKIDEILEINDITNTKEISFIINNELNYEKYEELILTNYNIKKYIYDFKIRYYDKVFRNSDIYGVYLNTNEILNTYNFIKTISMQDNGSPFGVIISDKILDDKIDNINYKLKIKMSFILYIIIVYLIILIIYLIYKLRINKKIIFDDINECQYKLRIVYMILIMLFAIFVRLFWAYQQEGMYWDEYHTLTFSNKGTWYNNADITNYINIKGYDILKDLTIDDSSLKDCFADIKRLYENTNDPFISNLYYSLLRLSFIGREAVDIKNIIMTGTILNCIFFIISFIFLYKILKLIFEYKDDCILFSLLIMSLSPISISFSMFLRPYQMQETFFIVITYLVIDTIFNNKYSVKNLIITTITAGIGYLTLYSSMLFVLILSAMLFINYIGHLKCIKKINILNPLIKIEDYRIILYYAVSFISALFISRLLYVSFFSSLFNANNRASSSLIFSGKLFDYINNLSFNGLLCLLPLIITCLLLMVITYLFYFLKNNKNLFITIKKDKFKLLLFIIILGIVYALLGDLSSPYKLERYSAPSYILILFAFPLIFSLINNKKIKYILFILLSIIYIYNVTNSERLSYFEQIDKEKYVLTENIKVYSYNSFFYFFDYHYMNTNLYYTYIDNENDLNIVTNDNKFYFLVNNETKYILTNSIFKYYETQYLNNIGDIVILKLEKK